MKEFCDMLGLQYEYYVNEHRYHGFTLTTQRLKGYLVIAADFSITEEEMQTLVDGDIVVLSTDHHDIKYDFIDIVNDKLGTEGIIINNQYSFEPEEDKYLSGAGVFYELICSIYPEFKSKLRDALVGITLLSDIRPTENDKAKKYLKATYSIDPETPYIKYLIEQTLKDDFTFGLPRIDRNFIDYTLSPTINALLRFNKTEEAIDFVLMKGLKSGDTYRKSQTDLMSIMASRALVMKYSNVIILAIVDIYFTDMPNIVLSDFIGLLCSNIKDRTGGTSVLGFTISNNVITRASFRGRYDDIPYLSGFRHIGITSANGHQNAFGIKEFEPTNETWTQINDLVGDLESNHERTVQIIETPQLGDFLNQKGYDIARENCYVRDCFRTYIKYVGNNIIENKRTYKMRELTYDDKLHGKTPDVTKGGKGYLYLLDNENKKIPKYIEYIIDGRMVKSFGDNIENCVILPMLEKGYLQLYLKPTPE